MLYQRCLRISLFLLISASMASARDLALVSNKSNAVAGMTVPDLIKVCKAQNKIGPMASPSRSSCAPRPPPK